MTNYPCQFGLKCPYLCFTDDYDLGCTYPKLAKNVKEDETVVYVYDADCELCDMDSDLYWILDAYSNTDAYKVVDEAIKNLKEKFERQCEETKKMFEETKRFLETDEGKKLLKELE